MTVGVEKSSELPVRRIEPDILTALRNANRLVLTAPTGSGKTTQVPQILHQGNATGGQIIVLQPRRLATRMVARRVAHEIGGRVGDVVGYQTRYENFTSDRTRIRFMTEGLFLRLMQSDPALRGVGAVVLDEFHERNIAGDTALGLVKNLQESSRPDLQLLIMSATLDAAALADALHCPALTTHGRTYPVDIHHIPRRSQAPIWQQAADALYDVVHEQRKGDVLIFMPGAFEISRTIDACRARLCGLAQRLLFFPLHGSLAPAQQDLALGRVSHRKVIVATNIAETSLTIEGITAVIDSGLARALRYDADRQINMLRIEPISRASADQRSGRAGRTAPGLCVRLWTQQDHHQVHPAVQEPEVRRIDLSEAMLRLRAMGIQDVAAFPWLDPPPPAAMDAAERLLQRLGAIDPAGRLTPQGLRMAEIPAHPRIARMLIEAAERCCLDRAVVWAALIGERDVTQSDAPAKLARLQEPDEPASDLAVRERALHAAAEANFSSRTCDELGLHSGAARQVDQVARLLANACRGLGATGQPGATGRPEALRRQTRAERAATADLIRSLLAGFPDHLAMKLDPQRPHCAMPGRKRVILDRGSLVRRPGLLLAVAVHEIGRGDRGQTVLSLASEVDPQWLDSAAIQTRTELVWNEQLQAAEEIEQRIHEGLVLHHITRPPADPHAAADLIVERVLSGELQLQNWDEAVQQWIERVRCVAEWFPDKRLMRYPPDDLRIILHEIVGDAARFSQVQGRPCLPAIIGALNWDDQQFVQQMAPTHLPLPGGRPMKITYQASQPPRGRAKIQDLYGLTDTPRIAAGRIPILLEILAPNFRPIQVTNDLPNFWKTLYPQARAELRRRYPKHEWR